MNIRGAVYKDGKNEWPLRKTLAVSTIINHDPDIIAFQEMQGENFIYMGDALEKYERFQGQLYDNYHPHSYLSIFWKKDLWDYIDSGGFWLSKTPWRFSSSWDSNWVRACSWIKLKDKNSKAKIMVMDTHLDYNYPISQQEGVKLILRKAASSFIKDIIILGDFNDQDNSSIRNIMADAGYIDSFKYMKTDSKKESGHAFTYHRFLGENYSGILTRMDRILFSSLLKINNFWIIKDRVGEMFPSDHYPIMSDFQMPL